MKNNNNDEILITFMALTIAIILYSIIMYWALYK